jgi:hypothetical protein
MLFTIGAVLGNGILAPNLRHELTTPLILIPELNIDFSVGGAWWAMLWSMFGYYEPSTLGYFEVQFGRIGSANKTFALRIQFIIALFATLVVMNEHFYKFNSFSLEQKRFISG